MISTPHTSPLLSRRSLLLGTLGTSLGLACDETALQRPSARAAASSETAVDLAKLATIGDLGFALALYGQACKSAGNLGFSPLALRVALAMVHAGAKGQTRRELGELLRLPEQDDLASMLLVLPEWHDLRALESAMAETLVRSWRGKMKRLPVHVTVPQLEANVKSPVGAWLRALEVGAMFDDRAEPSDIATGPVRVSAVRHTAKIRTDKVGTKLAGVADVAVAILPSAGLERTKSRRSSVGTGRFCTWSSTVATARRCSWAAWKTRGRRQERRDRDPGSRGKEGDDESFGASSDSGRPVAQ